VKGKLFMINNDTEKQNCNIKNSIIIQNNWDDIEDIINKIDINYDQIECKNSDKGIILFGVGIYGQIALQYFRRNDINVLCYCDNDINKQGKVINGIPVISLNELNNFNYTSVVITARHCVKEISEQLNKLHINNFSFDIYFVKKMIDKYKCVYLNLLNEPRSREVYIQIIKSMLFSSNEYCSSVMEGNAFWAIPQFSNTGNEIFVDAGAFVGDTLEQFIWNNIGAFKKIYAFEPGEKQYTAMQYRIKRLIQEWCIEPEKIVSVKAGLGEKNSTLLYTYNDSSPLCSNFITDDVNESSKVNVYSLDSFIGDGVVSFIKSDIEGFELEMLKGAANLIKRCRPKLAISIYHKPEDLFEIPKFIHSLVPEYKMAIRHHASTLVDTVLYCWI
jgi:FkbM family methyltransferase